MFGFGLQFVLKMVAVVLLQAVHDTRPGSFGAERDRPTADVLGQVTCRLSSSFEVRNLQISVLESYQNKTGTVLYV